MNMISTGAFLPEMDASNKQETLAEKFARVWEKKNSKAARAGGVSLMALSLAACGSDSAEVAEEEAEDITPPVVTPEGVDETLTSEEDTFVGVAGGDDTFTATSATLTADDNIVDTSSTDSDTLNVTLTAAAPAMDVSGIENVNVTWDSLLEPAIDLDDVSGATVTVTTARAGHNGNITITNADANSIVVSGGFDGTLDVGGLDGANVTSASATTVDVGTTGVDADGTIVIDAAAATTVTATGGDDVTIIAAAAEAITVAGGDAEALAITAGVDADLSVTGNANTVATVTSTAAEAIELTLGAYTADSMALSGLVDISSTNALISEETITGAGTVTVSDELDTMDISDIVAEGFVFETQDGGATGVLDNGAVVLTVASGQALTFEQDASGTAGTTIQTTADDDAAADSIDITLNAVTAQAIIVDTVDQDIETVNLTVAPAATFDDTADFTIADIQGNSAGGTAINVTSTDADVEVTIQAFDAASLDGSAVAGELDVTQTTNETLSVIGAAGATSAIFAGTVSESTFESTNDEDDSVTFVTTDGAATAVFAGGDNAVVADALADGDLSVTAGSGDDTVNMDDITAGHAVLALGAGDNSVTLGNGGNMADGGSVTVTTGAGDNTLVIEDNGVAGFTITMDFGEGTGTLDMSEGTIDLTDGTFNFTGLDVIAIGGSDTLALVDATLLDGATVTITGNSDASDLLTVVMEATAAVTNDFSGVTMSNDAALDIGGLAITGSANDDTVIATAGDDTFDGSNNADYTLTMGEGADTVTMGTGEVTINVASGDSGVTAATMDTLVGFTSGTDSISTGIAGSLTNYTEVDLAAVAASNIADALAGANGAMDGTIQFVLVENASANGAGDIDMQTDSVLFIDWDLDGTADASILLDGVLSGGFAGTDIIA